MWAIIAWIILGLIAGFIASKIVNKTGSGMLADIVLGVVGAIVGGYWESVGGNSESFEFLEHNPCSCRGLYRALGLPQGRCACLIGRSFNYNLIGGS